MYLYVYTHIQTLSLSLSIYIYICSAEIGRNPGEEGGAPSVDALLEGDPGEAYIYTTLCI